MTGVALPFYPLNDEDNRPSQEKTIPPGGDQEVRWKVVAKTAGFAQASIIAGRLKAEGIPAHVWQEGAGRAIGLTVGILGTGYISVPEELADKAERILAEGEQEWDQRDEALFDDEEDE